MLCDRNRVYLRFFNFFILSGADVFGIEYKPFNKKKEEYSMPKGAAFEDEAEFEIEMNKSKIIKNNGEDDEFDIDVSEDIMNNKNGQNNQNIGWNSSESESTAAATVAVAVAVAAKRSADIAARLQREEEEEILFMAALKNENKLNLEAAERLKSEELGSGSGIKNSENSGVDVGFVGKKPPSSILAAKQALEDIVSIYSNGLGDQEVLLLDIKDEKLSKLNNYENTAQQIQIQKGVSTTIDEGDEDEDEREEQIEVVAKIEKVFQHMKLEAEWDALESSEEHSSNNVLSTDYITDIEFKEMKYSEALEYLRYVQPYLHYTYITIDKKK